MPSQPSPLSTIHMDAEGRLILSGWGEGAPSLPLPFGGELMALRAILRARRDAWGKASPCGMGSACQPLASTLAALWRSEPSAQAKAAQAAHSAQVLRTHDIDALAELLLAD